MQLSKNTIGQIATYIIQNSAALTASGLFEGKAGHALCLFEISRLTHDEKIEDSAFQILQEALLSKTQSITFGNGLSGIGYVLLYLIKYKHIEADFNDLFEKQHLHIMKVIETSSYNANDISVLPYLVIYREVIKRDSARVDKAIESLIDNAIREILDYLVPEKWLGCTSKLAVITKLNQLAQALFRFLSLTYCRCGNHSSLATFMQQLQHLYMHSYVALDVETLYYIHVICNRYDIDITFSDIPIEIDSIELSTMNLSKIINLHILHHLDSSMLRPDAPLPFDALDDTIIEDSIYRFIGSNNLLCTYDSGLLRIMIYYALRHAPNHGCREKYLELLA